MTLPLLPELVAILGLAVIVIYVCGKLRIPPIVGLILTGVIIGPYGVRLVTAVDQVDALAQFGIVALLFVTGVQFSLKNALRIKYTVLFGGPIQIGLTALPVMLILEYLGLPRLESILLGLMLANSSTAIMLRLLQDRLEIDSAHGRAAVGISVFQDVVTIQMMLFIPFLAGEITAGNPVLILFEGLAIIAVVVTAAYWIVPRILYAVARVRSREVFLMAVLFLGLSIAMFADWLGLSLALGAFLAGLIISESDYSQAALSFVQPFRDVFTSIFFVSIGMLLDTQMLLEIGPYVALGALGLVVLKAVVAAAAMFLIGSASRTATLAGVILSQVGEASFVPAWAALAAGVISMRSYQVFLAVAIIAMASTPILYPFGESLVNLVNRLPLPLWMKSGWSRRAVGGVVPVFADHIVIVGFGVCGRDVVRAAERAKIRYIAVELNAEAVAREKQKGRAIIYGDATQEAILEQAGIEEARVLVVALPDSKAATRIVQIAKRVNPGVHAVVRVRYASEADVLLRNGADHIVVEEIEAAVEIFAHTLSKYLVPRQTIEKFVAEAHAEDYRMFRSLPEAGASFEDMRLSGVGISAINVQEGSAAAGATLAELALHGQTGVVALAIRRDGQIVPGPGGLDRLEVGDDIYVIGTPEAIAAASSIMSEPHVPDA